MNAFVTGSTGLLGNNLVRLLVEQGHSVRGLVRSEQKGKRLLGDTGATLIQGDMKNVAGFASRLDGCEVVFHTAAYFREYYQPGDHWQALEAINIKGTLSLMEEADRRGVRRFVHVSSAGTIGMKPDGSAGDETTPLGAEMLKNGYFRSKVEGDKAIQAWQPTQGMEIIEILPAWMWGPGDAAPTNAGQLAQDFLARKVPGIVDGGTNVVDARDVAKAMIVAAERGRHKEKYIIGGRYCSMEDILEGLERVTGIPAPKMHLPHAVVMTYAGVLELYGRITGKEVLATREGVRLLHAKHTVTSAKAERELGATFRPLDETLRDTVVWYKGQSTANLQAEPV